MKVFMVIDIFHPSVEMSLLLCVILAQQPLPAFTSPGKFRNCICHVDFYSLQDLMIKLSSCEDYCNLNNYLTLGYFCVHLQITNNL